MDLSLDASALARLGAPRVGGEGQEAALTGTAAYHLPLMDPEAARTPGEGSYMSTDERNAGGNTTPIFHQQNIRQNDPEVLAKLARQSSMNMLMQGQQAEMMLAAQRPKPSPPFQKTKR